MFGGRIGGGLERGSGGLDRLFVVLRPPWW